MIKKDQFGRYYVVSKRRSPAERLLAWTVQHAVWRELVNKPALTAEAAVEEARAKVGAGTAAAPEKEASGRKRVASLDELVAAELQDLKTPPTATTEGGQPPDQGESGQETLAADRSETPAEAPPGTDKETLADKLKSLLKKTKFWK